jgi:hypothetical protein
VPNFQVEGDVLCCLNIKFMLFFIFEEDRERSIAGMGKFTIFVDKL